MRRFEREKNYGQRRTYLRNSYRKEYYRKNRNYDHDYADFEGKFESTFRKNSRNTPDLYKRMIKKRKVIDKEREGMEALFNSYNYQEAFDYFKKISECENYPTLKWDDNNVDINRLSKIDLGKFDQRRKFVEMFENNNGENVNISIRVDFSYGGIRHDMFIEQPEKGYKYNTDKFLFKNNINFGEEQPSNDPSYLKPYLSRKDKNGILAKFIKYPEKIQKFAINVLRIMKLSPKGILPVNLWNMDIDRVMLFESFEIAGMILSSERLRSKKSLLLSYIEFYKLKHITDPKKSFSMLLDMFDRDGPILKFPASPGGKENIQNTHPFYIYKRFLDMIKYSPEFMIVKQCKNKYTQRQLMDKFFHGKLEKIRAVLENRPPEFKSKFKSAVRDYTLNSKTSQTKEIKTNASSYDQSSHSVKSNTLNEVNFKYENNISLKVENNHDEYFDNCFDNFSNTEYDSIFNNAVSSEPSSSQQSKIENDPDEYFDNYSNNFSDTDYDSILNNAISSELGSSQQSKVENDPDEYFDNYSNNFSDTDYDSILINAVSSELGSSQQSKVVEVNKVKYRL